jgi:hypothetical protein
MVEREKADQKERDAVSPKRKRQAERERVRSQLVEDLATELAGLTDEEAEKFPDALRMPEVEVEGGGKLTKWRADRILEKVWEGHAFELAAKAAAVTVRTVRVWRKKGKAGKHPYVDFEARFDVVTGHGSMRIEAEVIKSKSPIALLRLLAVRHPEIYGDVTREEGASVRLYLPENQRG